MESWRRFLSFAQRFHTLAGCKIISRHPRNRFAFFCCDENRGSRTDITELRKRELPFFKHNVNSTLRCSWRHEVPKSWPQSWKRFLQRFRGSIVNTWQSQAITQVWDAALRHNSWNFLRKEFSLIYCDPWLTVALRVAITNAINCFLTCCDCLHSLTPSNRLTSLPLSFGLLMEWFNRVDFSLESLPSCSEFQSRIGWTILDGITRSNKTYSHLNVTCLGQF